MTEDIERRDGSPLDAMEAVAIEGTARNRPPIRTILLVLLLGIIAVCAVAAALLLRAKSAEVARLQSALDTHVLSEPPGKLAEWPVAVLLPNLPVDNESTASDAAGSVADNAARQWEGFVDAFEEVGADQHHLNFNYPFDTGDPTHAEIQQQIEAWYDEGIRTFIITMSQAALNIKDKFIDWADDLPENDRPVLMATVASAPGIATREQGVFRHYIRSEEESSVLATYIEALGAVEVGIFYVEDQYGIAAHKLLNRRLINSVPNRDEFSINLRTEQEDIRQAVPTFVGKTVTRNNAVAVIIGYGPMIANTIRSLVDNGFNGKILVASTFTEEAWRPDLNGLAHRVRTVGHGTVDPIKNRRGVVYQFSYLTLRSALSCGSKGTRGVEAFWSCWTTLEAEEKHGERGADWTSVDFTTDGDSIVSLRLLKVDED